LKACLHSSKTGADPQHHICVAAIGEGRGSLERACDSDATTPQGSPQAVGVTVVRQAARGESGHVRSDFGASSRVRAGRPEGSGHHGGRSGPCPQWARVRPRHSATPLRRSHTGRVGRRAEARESRGALFFPSHVIFSPHSCWGRGRGGGEGVIDPGVHTNAAEPILRLCRQLAPDHGGRPSLMEGGGGESLQVGVLPLGYGNLRKGNLKGWKA
jgi:hypothetical protein